MAAEDNLVCPNRIGAESNYQIGEGIRIEEPISGQVFEHNRNLFLYYLASSGGDVGVPADDGSTSEAVTPEPSVITPVAADALLRSPPASELSMFSAGGTRRPKEEEA